ncbi:C4-dicarboxylate transporter DcuC [Singulisphaera acidiphila]|uniref:C4-dicarboxylate transporter n=1 Tax=Singulisphaera acidiphila (strain ATCC BAA-1392 / DSM 18658 / VKM B-2454 / MOB10) TaxID=886293 RepID=L0DCA9_SINAD|nr:C4-dicarboxylate transporter DcuC [Singulisphaera acidiphila]AGA27014.1 C4-dicarboxylate transporter [Singulisphaera acidiphila DSM 18658]
MQITIALLVVALSVGLIVRRHDIRLTLLGGGLTLAFLAGRPLAVLDTFARSMVAPMVAPICAAMGFAAVLRTTGCDRQLVRLLLAPLNGRRWAVLPGGIVSAYLVNLAVPSQSSVAAMLGPILVPLLIAAKLSPAVAGAALVLGASFGGDLLNPAAQDVQALSGLVGVSPLALSVRVIPASLAGLAAAIAAFVLFTARATGHPIEDLDENVLGPEREEERINLLKAIVPLVPVSLLLLAHGGLRSLGWLLRVEGLNARPDLVAAIPVVRALLIGFALAALIGWRDLRQVVQSFFDGMGASYRDVISLTIVAQCFGAGVVAVGLGDLLIKQVGDSRWGMASLAVSLPWSLATLSGSGSGPVLAFAQACIVPLGDRSEVPMLGALTCLAAAFGRTMSPVSAVVLCSAGIVGVSPPELIRPLLPALIVGASVAFVTMLSLG